MVQRGGVRMNDYLRCLIADLDRLSAAGSNAGEEYGYLNEPYGLKYTYVLPLANL